MTRAPSPRERYRDVSEADFQAQILLLLAYNGWRVAHFRTAMVSGRYMTPVQADGAGFPDLLAIHPATGDRLVAELKREYGSSVTPAQAQWLAWFELAGVEANIWRPSQIDAIIARCRKARTPPQ